MLFEEITKSTDQLLTKNDITVIASYLIFLKT